MSAAVSSVTGQAASWLVSAPSHPDASNRQVVKVARRCAQRSTRGACSAQLGVGNDVGENILTISHPPTIWCSVAPMPTGSMVEQMVCIT